jgi:hemoglobin/transferrin/lactoferrin receptor protein
MYRGNEPFVSANRSPMKEGRLWTMKGMRFVLGYLFAAMGLAVCRGGVARAASAQTNDAKVIQAPEIVVTASRTTRDIQSEPSAVYRLSGSDGAMREGNRTLPEMLDGLPSVMVQKTSYGQGSPYLRGVTGFRTLCMVDGVRLNNSVFRDGPNQYWNTIDPLSIGDYEVVMGPGSTLYGSDAVGGVVNALSMEPPDWTGSPDWERRLYYRGSTAERSSIGRVQVGGRVSEQLGFVGGYSLKSFGDLRGGRDVGVQEHTGYDESDFDAKLKCYLDADTALTLAHQSVRQDDAWRTHRTIYGIEWEGLSHGSDKVHSFDQSRDLTYLRLEADKLDGFADALQATVSRHAQGEDMLRVNSDDTQDRQGFDVTTWGGTLQLDSLTAWGQWNYGLDYYHDVVDSYARKYTSSGALSSTAIQGPVADDATYDSLGLYVQDTLSYFGGGLDVIPGLRYTFSEADANRVRNPTTGSAMSLNEDWQSAVGSLRLLVPLTEDRRHVLYGGVSQGERAPNLSDLTRFDTARSTEIETAAPDLDPERFTTYEIGIKSRTERLVSILSCYYTTIDGMIVRTPTGATVNGYREVTKKNAGDGFIQGVELSEMYRFSRTWSAWVNGSWMDGRVDAYPTSAAEQERDYTSRLMPPTAELGLRWQTSDTRYWCELVGNFAAKASRLSAEDERDTQRIPPGGTPGYDVYHARAGTKICRYLDVALAVENLLDADYRIHGSGVNEAGRNVILTANCTF